MKKSKYISSANIYLHMNIFISESAHFYACEQIQIEMHFRLNGRFADREKCRISFWIWHFKKISEQFQDKYEWNNLYSQVAISIGNRSDFLYDSGSSYLKKGNTLNESVGERRRGSNIMIVRLVWSNVI